jgi:O-antigen ligase
VEVAAETGLAGLVPFVGAMLLILYNAWRRRGIALRLGDKEGEGLATACVLALLTYLIGIAFLPLAYPRYLWILAGLTMAVALPRETESSA